MPRSLLSRVTLALAGVAVLAIFSPLEAWADKPARDKKEPYDPFASVPPTEKAIALYESQAKGNPKNCELNTYLGQLYIRQARESGLYSSYEKAEAAIQRALKVKPSHLPALACQASILNAQHRFKESLRLAQDLYRKHPKEHGLLLAIGDAQLELGNYDEAESAFRIAKKRDSIFWLDSRNARLAELKGDDKAARDWMEQACKGEAFAAITKEGRAWYHFRLGELFFNAGDLEQATKHLQDSLTLHPRFARGLAFMGKVRAGQGKFDEAIKLYVQAIGISAEPFMLADLGDLYTKTGKTFLARLNHEKLEQAGKQDVYARELAMFYSDHGRNLDDALTLAKKDLGTRRDVYSYDTLAWALCKNRRYTEAAEAIAAALRPGIKDASFHYHAGMIYHGMGEKDKARRYLEQALKINPHFSILQADEARKTLKALGG